MTRYCTGGIGMGVDHAVGTYDDYEWSMTILNEWPDSAGWYIFRQGFQACAGGAANRAAGWYHGIQGNIEGYKRVIFSCWGAVCGYAGAGPNDATHAFLQQFDHAMDGDSHAYGYRHTMYFPWQEGETLSFKARAYDGNLLSHKEGAPNSVDGATGITVTNNGTVAIATSATGVQRKYNYVWGGASGALDHRFDCFLFSKTVGTAAPEVTFATHCPVTDDSDFTAFVWARGLGGNTATFRVMIDWYNASDVLVGSTGSVLFNIAMNATFQQGSITGARPTGAVTYAKVRVVFGSMTNGQTCLIDMPQFALDGGAGDGVVWSPGSSKRVQLTVAGDQHGDVPYSFGWISGDGEGIDTAGPGAWGKISQWTPISLEQYAGPSSFPATWRWGHPIIRFNGPDFGMNEMSVRPSAYTPAANGGSPVLPCQAYAPVTISTVGSFPDQLFTFDMGSDEPVTGQAYDTFTRPDATGVLGFTETGNASPLVWAALAGAGAWGVSGGKAIYRP